MTESPEILPASSSPSIPGMHRSSSARSYGVHAGRLLEPAQSRRAVNCQLGVHPPGVQLFGQDEAVRGIVDDQGT